MPFFFKLLQDFLFPKGLQSSHRPRHTFPHPSPPGDTDRPLLPPVKHLSFHSPVTTCPDSWDKPTQMPPVSLSPAQALPSVHDRQKLQLTEPPAGSGLKIHPAFRNPARYRLISFMLRLRADCQRCAHPRSAQLLKLEQQTLLFKSLNAGKDMVLKMIT